MATYSGKLKEPRGLFALLQKMMQRENRLQQLVHEAGGTYNLYGDEVVIRGLTGDQFVSITQQLDKEFGT